MTKKDLRIVFMGTPDFAVGSLKALLEHDFNVVGVITAPDKPAGRGQKMRMSAVKQFAVKHDLHVMQPKNLKSKKFLQELRDLQANLQVVVAFRMLPELVFGIPELGCFNLHASLLPQYRGAAPINWAVINGEKETGVTTFFLKKKIDTGNIILQESVTIAEDDTAGSLHDKLMNKGAELVVKTCQAIEDGTAEAKEQITEGLELKSAPKIFREDCEINWEQPTQQVYDFIRGLSPYPAAWTTLQGKNFKIYEMTKEVASCNCPPGEIDTDKKSYLKFKTQNGWINCQTVQIEGKRRMQIGDFLRGFQWA